VRVAAQRAIAEHLAREYRRVVRAPSDADFFAKIYTAPSS